MTSDVVVDRKRERKGDGEREVTDPPFFDGAYPDGETYPCRIHGTPTHNERP